MHCPPEQSASVAQSLVEAQDDGQDDAAPEHT